MRTLLRKHEHQIGVGQHVSITSNYIRDTGQRMILLGWFHKWNGNCLPIRSTWDYTPFFSGIRVARYTRTITKTQHNMCWAPLSANKSSDTNTITYNQAISNIKTPTYTKFCSDYSVMKNVKDAYRYFIVHLFHTPSYQ